MKWWLCKYSNPQVGYCFSNSVTVYGQIYVTVRNSSIDDEMMAVITYINTYTDVKLAKHADDMRCELRVWMFQIY